MSKQKQSILRTKTTARVLLAAVFVLLAAVCVFAGAGVGAEVDFEEGDLVTTESQIRFGNLEVYPTGSLTTGDNVVATVNMEIPGGTYDSSSYLNLSSDLDAAEWTIVLQQGGVDGVIFSKTGKSVTLTSFDITYPESIVLKISVSGVVSSESSGQNITVMKIKSFGKDGLTSWSTPTQYVNNTTPSIGFEGSKLSPTGSLTTGDKVSATVNMEIPGGTYDSSSYLNLSSDLDAAEWTIVIQQGGVDGVIFSKTGKSVTLTSFDITYPESIVLKISVSGVVSSESSGQNITVMKIKSFGKDGLTSWSAPTRYVNNTTSPQIETTESGSIPSPTITPTVTPLPTPTVALTTEKGQTTEQTKDLPKSPAPILGILAGFGAVALIFTIRQR